MTRSRVCFLAFILAAAVSYGCGSSSSSSTGTLSLSLSDAASNEYKAIYVTVKEVQVHMGGGDEGRWYTVASPNMTYNLLTLVNGIMGQLSLSYLETGTYTQIRLILGSSPDSSNNILGVSHPFANYVVDDTSQYHELKVPSGYRTGIKLVHEFEIVEGVTTELVLDFDTEKCVVRSGNSRSWKLNPVIRVLGTTNKAIVSGIVTDAGNAPIAGARVSIQRYDTETHEVAVFASTLTAADGEYQIYVEPGLYTVLVCKDGYAPACSMLMTGSNEDYEQSFALPAVTTGQVTCSVTLPQGSQDQTVGIHFLKTSPCDEANLVEVKAVYVSQSGSYPVDLPAGAYVVIASDGAVTLPGKNAATGSTVSLDFTAG
ncbi:MAG TPA: DUF4382 domain-containing protein [Deltaproteobacteria bacterium]|nr:DUF4382 domain-containing protein [Deltaproteobacteria bacterium]HQH99841.1 DUF4382 domain-containing protein [Deltaproteobacteria bacterium]